MPKPSSKSVLQSSHQPSLLEPLDLRNDQPVSQSLLNRPDNQRLSELDSPKQPMVRSILNRPNHNHPFAPFIADDLASIERIFDEGFDLFWRGSQGVTCVMEAASHGNSASVHLAFSLCNDPAALAILKSDAGLDAFDMAAQCGSVSCLWELERHLPSNYRSSVRRGFVWHAVQCHDMNTVLADAWMVHLLSNPSRIHRLDVDQALIHARELSLERAVKRLEAFTSKNRD